MEIGGIKLALNVGDMITFERTFTAEDVELFTKISGDGNPWTTSLSSLRGSTASLFPHEGR